MAYDYLAINMHRKKIVVNRRALNHALINFRWHTPDRSEVNAIPRIRDNGSHGALFMAYISVDYVLLKYSSRELAARRAYCRRWLGDSSKLFFKQGISDGW
jgi:hypothetical protein